MGKLDYIKSHIESIDVLDKYGKVENIIGLLIESSGPDAPIGEICKICRNDNNNSLLAEVIGFRNDKTLLMPYGDSEGITRGSKVFSTGSPLTINVSNELIGRVLNGMGEPIDGKGPFGGEKCIVMSDAPHPLTRRRINEPLSLGIRSIDALLTCGKGQRLGIFAGSGIGKSTLLGMIARFTKADLSVIALIGERGKEVREFIERDLGEGINKSIVVVATSDQPHLIRIKGAFIATTIAEYFREKGLDVLLMMDSITRIARAQREVGLAMGEPPTYRGFVPSVFNMIPKLLERAGTSDKGSITGLYTVLVESDDMLEPIADLIRATVDGHIVLTRQMAEKNLYPPVDILQSISRSMIDVVSEEHYLKARKFRQVLATYKENELLLNINAYVKGSNPEIDYAVSKKPEIDDFLRQGIFEKADYNDSKERLFNLF